MTLFKYSFPSLWASTFHVVKLRKGCTAHVSSLLADAGHVCDACDIQPRSFA